MAASASRASWQADNAVGAPAPAFRSETPPDAQAPLARAQDAPYTMTTLRAEGVSIISLALLLASVFVGLGQDYGDSANRCGLAGVIHTGPESYPHSRG